MKRYPFKNGERVILLLQEEPIAECFREYMQKIYFSSAYQDNFIQYTVFKSELITTKLLTALFK